MKFCSKIMCLLLVCLTLSSCNLDDYLYYSIKPNLNSDDVDDVTVFLDGTYAEYVGGQDAKAFFDKYVRADSYKDIAFHYHYSDHILTKTNGILLNPSIFAVDIYHYNDDFFEIAYDIMPLTNMANRSYSEYLSPNDGNFLVTRVIDENLNQDNLYSVMMDDEHRTIRYVVIIGFYNENLRSDDEPLSPGDDDDEIRDITQALLPQLKWNTKSPYNSNDPYDWIFDYSSKNNVETTETNAEESTEESS